MPDDRAPDLTIADRKIADYLLNVGHAEGGSKARFFIARGFCPDAPADFLDAPFAHARPSRLVGEKDTGFGRKFVYEGPLITPDGGNPRVRSVWHRAAGDARRVLVTAYPI